MSKRTKEVDAYIDGAPAFARPILKRIRACYHRACPEIQETIKWGFPTFEYKGIVGNMAAFKSHAAYRFWKAGKLEDPHGILAAAEDTSGGGRRVTDVSQLPSDDILIDYIRRAVELNEMGIKSRVKKARKATPLRVPAALSAALKKSRKAAENFAAISTSCRNEYIEWISEAKQEATRNRRLATTLEWLEQGKSRNWKYERGGEHLPGRTLAIGDIHGCLAQFEALLDGIALNAEDHLILLGDYLHRHPCVWRRVSHMPGRGFGAHLASRWAWEGPSSTCFGLFE